MEVDHIFVGLNAMLFVVIITTALMLGYVFRRYQYHYLPDSAVSMILGFFIGLIMNLFDQGNQNEESLFIMFKPEIFFFIILPPIILDAGYTLKKANFFHNIFPILMYAVIGTFISTVFIGYG